MSTSVKSAGSAAVAFSLTFGLVALLAEEPAAARDLTVTAIHRELPSERVPVAGLDLASSEGSALLEARVRSASRRVCAVTPVGLAAASELSCRRSAQAAAAPKIASLVERARTLASEGRRLELGAAIVVSAPRS